MAIYKLEEYLFSFLSVISPLKWAWNFLIYFSLFPHHMPELVTEDFNKIGRSSCNYYNKQQQGSESEAVECAVCLCKIDDDDEIRDLRCDHLFHKVCLDRWIGHRGTTCPICRASLTPRRLVGGMEVLLFNYCAFDDSSHRETWWLR